MERELPQVNSLLITNRFYAGPGQFGGIIILNKGTTLQDILLSEGLASLDTNQGILKQLPPEYLQHWQQLQTQARVNEKGFWKTFFSTMKPGFDEAGTPMDIPTLASPLIMPANLRSIAEQTFAKASLFAKDKQVFLNGFIAGYVKLIKFPDSKAENQSLLSDPYDLGARAGMQQANTENGKYTLRDFGYELIDTEGFVYLNFEQSEFRPINNMTADNENFWWLEFAGSLHYHQIYSQLIAQAGGESRLIQQGVNPKKFIRVSCRGYLSQARMPGYGHMGIAEREFFVVEILPRAYK
jgi:hypothetical protein